jgi:hypothetical protein
VIPTLVSSSTFSGHVGADICVYNQAAVTYGDPLKNYETLGLGGWGSLPKSHTLVFCNSGDGVCGGAFSISAAHLSYTSNGDISKGVEFVSKFITDGGEGVSDAPPAPAGGAPKGGKPPKNSGMPKGSGAPKGTRSLDSVSKS